MGILVTGRLHLHLILWLDIISRACNGCRIIYFSDRTAINQGSESLSHIIIGLLLIVPRLLPSVICFCNFHALPIGLMSLNIAECIQISNLTVIVIFEIVNWLGLVSLRQTYMVVLENFEELTSGHYSLLIRICLKQCSLSSFLSFVHIFAKLNVIRHLLLATFLNLFNNFNIF